MLTVQTSSTLLAEQFGTLGNNPLLLADETWRAGTATTLATLRQAPLRILALSKPASVRSVSEHADAASRHAIEAVNLTIVWLDEGEVAAHSAMIEHLEASQVSQLSLANTLATFCDP